MDAVELVFKTLKDTDKALKAGEIAQLANLDRKVVDQAMKTLKAEGRIVSPRHCCWTVAE